MGSRLDDYGARPSEVFGNLADFDAYAVGIFQADKCCICCGRKEPRQMQHTSASIAYRSCMATPIFLHAAEPPPCFALSARPSPLRVLYQQELISFVRSCRLAIRSVLLRKSLGLADAVSGGTSMTREAGHTCHCARATVRTARCARPRHILHGSTRIVTARHGRTKGWLFAIRTLACLFSLRLFSF